MRTRFSIGEKLAVLYLIIAVPLLAVIGIGYTVSYQAQRRAAIRDRGEIAQVAARSLLGLLDGTRDSMRTAGEEILLRHRYTRDEQQRVLAQAAGGLGPVRQVVLTDTSGRVIASSDGRLIGSDLSSTRPFTDLVQSRSSQAIGGQETTGNAVTSFWVTRAIQDDNGRLVGIAGATIDTQRLDEAFPVEVSNGGANIIDSQGRFVYQSEVGADRLAAYDPTSESFVRSALEGRRASSDAWTSPIDGDRRIVTEIPIRELGWAAGASIPYEVALGPIIRSQLLSTALTALALLLGGVAAFAISKRVVDSLRRLVHFAEVVGEGRLDEPVELRTGDEIEEVGHSLESTRRNLQRYVSSLSDLAVVGGRLTASLQIDAVRDATMDAASLLFEAEGVGAWLHDPDTGLLEALFVAGRGAERIAGMTRRPGEGIIGGVFAERRPRIVRDIPQAAAERRAADIEGVHAIALAPLTIGAAPFGVLAVTTPRAAEWAEEGREMETLSVFASQLAVAITNARLYEQREALLREVQAERSAAEEAAADARRIANELDRIITSLADAVLVYDENGRVVKSNATAVESFGLDPVGLTRGELGERIRLRFPEGRRLATEEMPTARAAKGETVVGEILRFTRVGGGEFIIQTDATPLIEEGRQWGVVLVWHDVTRRERQRQLDEALNTLNAVVNATLDFDEIMSRSVVASAQAIGASRATVTLREARQWRIAHTYGWPPDVLGRRYRDEQSASSMAAVQERRVVFSNDTEADDRWDLSALRRLGIRSFLHVPLLVRDRVIGVLGFQHVGEPAPFSDLDVDFAARFGQSLSLALENARLYSAERTIADTLQSALLRVPKQIPGVTFGCLYRSATEAAKVGGDFYDIFEIEHGKVAVVTGDVSGKGIEAATMTSVVKNTVRAYAYGDPSPASVMSRTNDTVERVASSSSFITVFFGLLDTRDGTLTYCSAGHPPAIVRRKNVAEVLKANSPLIGAFPGLRFEEDTATLADDDVLLLYTDGVTETRCPGGFFGQDRLVATVQAAKPATAQTLPTQVFSEISSCTGGRLSDDVALFAVSLAPKPAESQPAGAVPGSSARRRT